MPESRIGTAFAFTRSLRLAGFANQGKIGPAFEDLTHGRGPDLRPSSPENLYSRNARTKLSKSPPVELMAFSMRVIGAESLIRL